MMRLRQVLRNRVGKPWSSPSFTVPSARPRILFSNASDFSTAQTNWATLGNKTPGTSSIQDGWDNGLMYLFGNASQQSTALANVITMLFGTTFTGNVASGFLPNWAYQGTAGNSQTSVGSYANEMKPSSAGSDHYRWNDWVAAVIDWCWAGFTTQQQTNLLNGYTIASWGGTTANGQTVSVPSYLTIANLISQQAWGDVGDSQHTYGMPGNNYYWGNFRNEINGSLAFYYEDNSGVASALMNTALTGTNSRLQIWKNAVSSGAMQNGLCPEGPEYGRYVMQYPGAAFWSLKRMGRDLWAETDFHRQVLVNWLLSGSSPAALEGDGANTYYQVFPAGDSEIVGGFPALGPVAGSDTAAASFNYGDFLTLMKLEYGSQAEGHYAAQALARWGSKQSPQFAILDPGTVTATDWVTASLPLDVRFKGGDDTITRNIWGSTSSVLFLRGIPPQKVGTYGHAHDDFGTWQWMRGGRWLSKEATGYSDLWATPVYQTTVAASPTPSTTTFAGTNMPTTSSWGTGAIITFTSGTLNGTSVTASSYNGTTGAFTVPAMAGTPAAGDSFVVAKALTTLGTYPADQLPDGDMAQHNGIWAGTVGPCNAACNASGVSQYRSSYGSTLWWDNTTSSKFFSAGYDLSGNFIAFDQGHPQYEPSYLTTYIREYYWLRALECLVVFDRLAVNAWAGNANFPAWPSAAATPTHWFCLTDHYMGAMTLDTVNKKATVTGGTQTMTVFTLLPTNSQQHTVSLTNFTGSHESDTAFYGHRYQVQDSGAAQRYFLHVIQGRDSTDVDVTASVTDSNPGAPTTGTFTVNISHATKGSATLTMPKGMTATEATVSITP